MAASAGYELWIVKASKRWSIRQAMTLEASGDFLRPLILPSQELKVDGPGILEIHHTPAGHQH